MYPAQIRPYSQPNPFDQNYGMPYPQHQDSAGQTMSMMPNKGPSWMTYDEATAMNGGAVPANQLGLGLGVNRNMGSMLGAVGGEETEQLWENLVNGE